MDNNKNAPKTDKTKKDSVPKPKEISLMNGLNAKRAGKPELICVPIIPVRERAK